MFQHETVPVSFESTKVNGGPLHRLAQVLGVRHGQKQHLVGAELEGRRGLFRGGCDIELQFFDQVDEKAAVVFNRYFKILHIPVL